LHLASSEIICCVSCQKGEQDEQGRIQKFQNKGMPKDYATK